MTKVFISQPMRGKTDEYIQKEREHLIRVAKSLYGDVKILDSYFKNYDGNALQFLSKSIAVLAEANVVIFAADWKNARGCRCENMIATEYGIEIVESYSDIES